MMDTEDLDDVLAAMMSFKEGVSDLNFTVGKPPQIEVHGRLEPVTFELKPEPLTSEETEAIALALMAEAPELRTSFDATGACDSAHTLGDGRRVRVNVFRARGEYSVVLRALPTLVPSTEELGLPAILAEIPKLMNGLVLVTGATGSGKSTTMTSILDSINVKRPAHVITLEDPIEFVHPHKAATMNQRELGRDFTSYAEGLRAALRQAPKVIFIGEIRDRETMEIALKAAETGHLVLSTLHTIDAGQTIGRVVGMFDLTEQQFVRTRLAEVLRFVVSQRLLPKERGGRVAAVEVMGSSLRVRELTIHGEDQSRTFYDVIRESKSKGWQTFDQHIVQLYEKDLISEETARSSCSDGSEVLRYVDQIKSKRGEETSDLGDLEMAHTRQLRR